MTLLHNDKQIHNDFLATFLKQYAAVLDAVARELKRVRDNLPNDAKIDGELIHGGDDTPKDRQA